MSLDCGDELSKPEEWLQDAAAAAASLDGDPASDKKGNISEEKPQQTESAEQDEPIENASQAQRKTGKSKAAAAAAVAVPKAKKKWPRNNEIVRSFHYRNANYSNFYTEPQIGYNYTQPKAAENMRHGYVVDTQRVAQLYATKESTLYMKPALVRKMPFTSMMMGPQAMMGKSPPPAPMSHVPTGAGDQCGESTPPATPEQGGQVETKSAKPKNGPVPDNNSRTVSVPTERQVDTQSLDVSLLPAEPPAEPAAAPGPSLVYVGADINLASRLLVDYLTVILKNH